MTTRFLFLSVLMGAMPLTMAAQDDDLYFTPKKSSKDAPVKIDRDVYDRPAYYCGSPRNVDEYNRRGKLKSYYQKIGTDSLGNDVIEFHEGDGTYGTADLDSTITIYPGSERYYDEDSDFAYSRRMGRFDDFYWDPAFYGYYGSPYWRGYYGWYDPWYGPYYTGWYGRWHNPWFYGYYGWGYPYYGWGGGWYGPTWHYAYNGPSGTRNHSNGGGRFYGNRSSFGSKGERSSFNINRNNSSRNGFGQRRSSFEDNNNRYQNQQPTQRPSYNNNQGGFGSNRGSFGGGSGFGGSRGSFGGGGGFGGGGSRGGGFGSRR